MKNAFHFKFQMTANISQVKYLALKQNLSQITWANGSIGISLNAEKHNCSADNIYYITGNTISMYHISSN